MGSPGSSTPRRTRTWLVGAAICTLAVIACVALAVAGVAGIMDGGYRPDAYAGRLDPVRTGLIVFALLGVVVFCMFVAIDLLRWRTTSDWGSWWLAMSMSGLAIVCASLAAMFIWAPPTAGPLDVPGAIVAGFYIGCALLMVGMVPAFVLAAKVAIERRDRKVLVAGLLFAAAVAFAYFVRR
jgi:hypothetical protein